MVSGMYLMAFAAAAYDFSVYSQFIKGAMALDQQELNTISLFLGVGDGVCFVAGVLYDLWQPWGVILLGIFLNAGGYLLAWLGLTGRLFGGLSNLRVWHLCLFLAVGANGQTFGETAVMVVVLRNFPSSRGTVMGLVKGFYGLSGAILPQIYYALFWDDPASFLLLAACLPTLVSLLCMPLMRGSVEDDDSLHAGHDNTTMHCFHTIAIALALYLLGIVVVENVTSLSRPLVAGLTSFMVFILCLPLAVVLWKEASTTSSIQEDSPVQSSVSMKSGQELERLEMAVAELSGHQHHPPDSIHCMQQCPPPPPILTSDAGLPQPTFHNHIIQRWIQSHLAAWPAGHGEDHSIAQAVMSLDLWILFSALACGLGAIMVLLNNMAQVGYSQGYSPTKINTLVALVNIWNFFGRIAAGSLSDMFMQGHRYSVLISRPALLCISVAILVVGNLMVALGMSGALYIASILAGLSLGAQYTLTAVIVSELFGLKTVGTTYTVLACAGPLAQYVLSVRVAGALYDHEASKQSLRRGSEILLCKGPQCFHSTFLIMTGVTAFGVFLCVVLTLRTMSYYKSKVPRG